MLKRVKAFAPATVANISCGFDILGFAIDKPGDEAVVSLSEKPGITIKNIFGNKSSLSFDIEKNCATVPIIEYLKHFGLEKNIGIELELYKNLPLSSGMGSSAASSVVGVYAVNHLLGNKITKNELLPFILMGEELACGCPHADNAAPSLLGGITLIREYQPLDIVDIDFPESLYCTLIHPHIKIDTFTARNILPKSIPLYVHVKQSGNIAGLITGFLKKDISLIQRSFKDIIVEPIRSELIPLFDNLKEAALVEGALGCSISGSGPSVFALSNSFEIANKIAESMSNIYDSSNNKYDIFVSKINKAGAVILEEE